MLLSRIGLVLLATAIVLGVAPTPVRTDVIIDANSFTFSDPTTPTANDFHLMIMGNFIGDPSSNVFPNREVTNNPGPPQTATAKFSGNSLANGKSHNVKFKATGGKASPDEL